MVVGDLSNASIDCPPFRTIGKVSTRDCGNTRNLHQLFGGMNELNGEEKILRKSSKDGGVGKKKTHQMELQLGELQTEVARVQEKTREQVEELGRK